MDNAAVVGRPEAKGPALPTTTTHATTTVGRPSRILTFSVWSDQGERGKEREETLSSTDGRRRTTRAFIPLPTAHPPRRPVGTAERLGVDGGGGCATSSLPGRRAGRQVLQDAVRPPMQARGRTPCTPRCHGAPRPKGTCRERERKSGQSREGEERSGGRISESFSSSFSPSACTPPPPRNGRRRSVHAAFASSTLSLRRHPALSAWLKRSHFQFQEGQRQAKIMVRVSTRRRREQRVLPVLRGKNRKDGG